MCIASLIHRSKVVQTSISAGVMSPLIRGSRLSIMDQFFLGGPLTLRGFNIKGVGPHEDGCALGANTYWSTAFHVYTPLPFRPGRGFSDLFRTHFFVNAGNLCNVNFASDQWKQGLLSSMTDGVRLSYGAGLVLRLGGIARLELNYVVPVRVQANDSVNRGLQFGIGVSFL